MVGDGARDKKGERDEKDGDKDEKRKREKEVLILTGEKYGSTPYIPFT